MREGYGSRSVCVSVSLSVCLSVNSLTATYFVRESQARCYEILYGVSNACIVWISLKMLCSPVLVTFAHLPPWIHPSTHPGSFSMDRMNNSRLFSRHEISSSSYKSCKGTACLPIVSEVTAKLDFPASRTQCTRFYLHVNHATVYIILHSIKARVWTLASCFSFERVRGRLL